MSYFLHILDQQGNFELIDGELLFLYPDLDKSKLIELTEEQYQTYLSLNGQQVRFIHGEFVTRPHQPTVYHIWSEATQQWEISPENLTALLSAKKTALLQILANKTDSFKAQFLVGYSEAEIESFYRQEQEARGNLPLMLLTELVEGREDIADIETLKAKVIEKADIFAIVMGKLFAAKQNFEKRIEQTVELEGLEPIEREIEQWQNL